MSKLRSIAIKRFSQMVARRHQRQSKHALEHQKLTLQYLLRQARTTRFGRDHHFKRIKSHKDFIQQVPVRDYEGLRFYFDKMVNGELHILWPGKPKYLAKTSGTTSGVKYIPISKESMPFHIQAARDATMNMLHHIQNFNVLNAKVMFLSGSPTLIQGKGGLDTGRLSGIVNHEIPKWLKKNQLPDFETNCIEDWEAKLDKIVELTAETDMRLISGIPPWVQMYYERLLETTGKTTVKDVFPNFDLFVYGGVNYEPYRQTLSRLVGAEVQTLETYPASEGFIAFQDRPQSEGLLLLTNQGIFYEFIPLAEVFNENPTRLTLADVELDQDYAIVLSTNAGLWAYSLGDTIRFVSKDPYRIIVSGRVKHFISAFGEHVIGKEVEVAMQRAVEQYPCVVREFTVAPHMGDKNNLPRHEWFVEFEIAPQDLAGFTDALDQAMQSQNIYYKDLITGSVLDTLKLTPLAADAFRNYMEGQGKLGGQNKVPRLSNDRKIASILEAHLA